MKIKSYNFIFLDFVEVEENEVDIFKEIVGLNAIQIQSQPVVQNTQESVKKASPEKLIEIVELLDESQKSMNLSDIEDYNSNLVQETNQLIKEKLVNDRLSNSIERYIIDDAKVII